MTVRRKVHHQATLDQVKIYAAANPDRSGCLQMNPRPKDIEYSQNFGFGFLTLHSKN